MKRLYLTLVFLLPATYVWSQSTRDDDVDFLALFEDICAQPAADGVSDHGLEQRLWGYYQQPLDLHYASFETLYELHILTDTQLANLFAHTARYGPLISIYELQAIPTLDQATIQRLLPFVIVEEVMADYRNRPLWQSTLGARHSYMLWRYARTLPTSKGYMYNAKKGAVPYVGSPHKVTTRLQLRQPWGLGLGFSANKGAGEAFTLDHKTRRYGCTSRFHLLLKNQKHLKALVLGDYAVGYGQGLVLSAGFSMNKSSETIKVIRTNNRGIRPHTSLGDAAFRGIATTWAWAPFAVTVYGSSVALDGKVKGNEDSPFVAKIARGGLYRTQSELQKKGTVQEYVFGSTIVYQGSTRGSRVGINVLHSHYRLPIYGQKALHKPIPFQGQHHTNGSLFYRYLWRNFHFFGEGGVDKSRHMAALAGVVTSISRYMDMTLLWRHYGQGFYSPYGKAFRENTTANCNEQGLYVGVRVRPVRRLYCDAYYDYFHFPCLAGYALSGYSWLAKVTYQLSRRSMVYVQVKAKVKPKKLAGKAALANYRQYIGKVCGNLGWTKALYTNTEVQCGRHRQLSASSWGYAVVQDVGYKVRKWQLKGRIAYFSTKPYPLYVYEPNVMHTGFNWARYQGQGMRYCVLMVCKPVPGLRLEGKYGLTWYYEDRKSIGAGQEMIQGKCKHTVGLQVLYRF